MASLSSMQQRRPAAFMVASA
uniref:Uncharacterized protein n=1 Tax=Arundo donax TaxID=35708 RepID=A0A0A9F0B2_ARUDO